MHVQGTKVSICLRKKGSCWNGAAAESRTPKVVRATARPLLPFKCRPLRLILRGVLKRFHMWLLSSEGSAPRTGRLAVLERSTSNNWSEKPKSASVCQREAPAMQTFMLTASSSWMEPNIHTSSYCYLCGDTQLLTHTQTRPASPPPP